MEMASNSVLVAKIRFRPRGLNLLPPTPHTHNINVIKVEAFVFLSFLLRYITRHTELDFFCKQITS